MQTKVAPTNIKNLNNHPFFFFIFNTTTLMEGEEMGENVKCIYSTKNAENEFNINVLWVSRHPPINAQIEALENKLGGINLFQLAGTVPNAEYVMEMAKKTHAEVIVPVLPLSMIARLAELCRKENIVLLWAEMEQVKLLNHEPKPEKDYDPNTEVWIKGYENTWKVMRFKGFKKIKQVKLELEDW